MWAALLAGIGGTAGLIKILTPLLAAIVSGLAGWLAPSPFQKAATREANTHDAESKAQNSRGDVADLDTLP